MNNLINQRTTDIDKHMLLRPPLLRTYLTLLMLFCISCLPSMAHTHTESPEQVNLQLSRLTAIFRPPERGAPDNTGNGSSRDYLRCAEDQSVMQPLLPEGRYGLTFQARPEIFVEISETSAQEALLVFRNETDGFYYQEQLPIQINHGVAKFQLSEEAPPLSPNQTYQWALSFICNEHFSLSDPMMIGEVTRHTLSADAEQTIGTFREDEQVEWLGANGYWYDLVKIWLRLHHPSLADSQNVSH